MEKALKMNNNKLLSDMYTSSVSHLESLSEQCLRPLSETQKDFYNLNLRVPAQLSKTIAETLEVVESSMRRDKNLSWIGPFVKKTSTIRLQALLTQAREDNLNDIELYSAEYYRMMEMPIFQLYQALTDSLNRISWIENELWPKRNRHTNKAETPSFTKMQKSV